MDYQRRILYYAFGALGDIIVIKPKLKMSEIEQFNQEAEKIALYYEGYPKVPMNSFKLSKESLGVNW